MPYFGEKLKQEREKRKITLEQISVSTKIGTRMLQALEEDKFSQLPGGIFNKGFVRAYSRFVGLDEDQTVAEYLQASGDAPPPSTEIASRESEAGDDGAREKAETVTRLEAISNHPSRQLPWGLFAAVLLLIALALSLWSRHERERVKQLVRPTPVATTTQLSGEGSSAGSSGMSNAMSSPNKAAGSAETGSPESLPHISSIQSTSVLGNTSGGSAPSSAPKTSPGTAVQNASTAMAAGEFSVAVQTREESWISITADGKSVSSELLPAGSERAIRGRKEVVVKVGNAGGVDLRFNGKKLDFGGEFGEVKTITFGPGGVLSNTSSPPSNP